MTHEHEYDTRKDGTLSARGQAQALADLRDSLAGTASAVKEQIAAVRITERKAFPDVAAAYVKCHDVTCNVLTAVGHEITAETITTGKVSTVIKSAINDDSVPGDIREHLSSLTGRNAPNQSTWSRASNIARFTRIMEGKGLDPVKTFTTVHADVPSVEIRISHYATWLQAYAAIRLKVEGVTTRRKLDANGALLPSERGEIAATSFVDAAAVKRTDDRMTLDGIRKILESGVPGVDMSDVADGMTGEQALAAANMFAALAAYRIHHPRAARPIIGTPETSDA